MESRTEHFDIGGVCGEFMAPLTMDNATICAALEEFNPAAQQVRDVLIDRFGKETIDELERQGKLEIIHGLSVEGC